MDDKMFENRNKTLVIINPKAGKMKTKGQLLNITDELSVGGNEVTFYTTKGRGDGTSLAENLGREFDTVICRGGDGTLNEVVNGLMKIEKEKRPPLGYVPSGSTNDFARSLNISSNPKKCVNHLLRGRQIPHDIGFFNGERYFTYAACFGAFTDLSYNTSQKFKNLFGHLAYTSQILDALRRLQRIKAKVTIDGDEVIEDEFAYGGVSSTLSLSNIIKMDRNVVSFDDGKFEVILVKFPKDINVFNKTSKCMLTRNYDPKYIYFRQAKKVEFEFVQDIAWTLDGEYGGTGTTAQIDVIEKAIDIIR
ncbi:MAG: YegS/Rv2252/BmrU family lipid kinase [Clostridia bacterium]|nr:YegS/Rv2252/BmrU family lipid kinase [Clostridia bacterium]